MSSAITIILVLGLVAAGAWCFTMGPCKGMLGNIKAGAIVKPVKVVKGVKQTVPACPPGTITTVDGCAEAVRSAYTTSFQRIAI